MKRSQRQIFPFALFILLLLWGCQKLKPEARGGDNELVVVVDPENVSAITKVIASIFTDTLYTPQPEPYYRIQYVEPGDFDDIKQSVNVIVGALGTNLESDGVKLMRQLLNKKQYASSIEGNNHLIFARNVFARNQNYLLINGPDLESILQRVTEEGPWLKHQFDALFTERQSKYLFESARQKDLEKELAQKYGWSLNIPWGYTTLRDSAEQGLFWIGREIPYRWLVIHWETGLVFSDSASVRKFAYSFLPDYLGNIRYTDYRFSMEPTDFNDWAAWKITGLWEHLDEAQGGPSIGYLFYDEKTDQTFFIFTMIFYPGKEKYILLRQVDIIAHSFRIVSN